MKKILAIAAVAFLFVATGALVAAELLIKPPSDQVGRSGATGPDVPPQAVERLSDDRYEAEQDRLLSIMKAQDPREAIQALKADMEKDASVTASCHDLLHEVGRASYEKYQDFGKAMQYQDEVCVSGYIHGVIEGYFKTSKDLPTALQTVCDGNAPHTYARWECQHGAGHGLMFESDNDLPGSLRHCDAFSDPFDQAACANGAYMENFNADQVDHVSKYLDPQRPLYPCDEAETHRIDCYMNAPIQYLQLHKNEYAGAAKACDEAPEADRGSCYYGVGAQATRRNIDRPAFVESTCTSFGVWRDACIRGAVSAFVGHYVSLTRALGICETFDATDRATCIAEARSMKTEYPDL